MSTLEKAELTQEFLHLGLAGLTQWLCWERRLLNVIPGQQGPGSVDLLDKVGSDPLRRGLAVWH